MRKQLSVLKKLTVWATALALGFAPVAPIAPPAAAGSNSIIIPTAHPQILVILGNSQSMDGNLSGAIMTGAAGDYTVPTGFTAPVSGATSGTTPYTVSGKDNSASRMNVAKASLQAALGLYADNVDFGLMDFGTSGSPALYATWVYYMSQNGGFTFASSAGTGTYPNPCYNSTSSDCNALTARYGSNVTTMPYLVAQINSDDPSVNDVLYAGGFPSVFVSYNGPHPSTPYPPNFSLTDYNNGNVFIGYNNTLPNVGPFGTSPTNAGYVPYSTEVMYAQRGFGYYNSITNTGNLLVPVGVNSASRQSTFNTLLAPESNDPSTDEIKSNALNSTLAAALQSAYTYYTGPNPPPWSNASCASKRYVLLITDGLPTVDLDGKAWPPLGSAAATGYGVTATIDPNTGVLTATNNKAVNDAIGQITALKEAGIDTYVIGVGAGVDPNKNPAAAATLRAMAIAGGTNGYYPATTPAQVATSLKSIVLQTLPGAVATASPAVPGVTAPDSLIYEPVQNNTSGQWQGHLLAMQIDSSGNVKPTPPNPIWDAATLMNATNRAALLQSNDPAGNPVQFTQLDAAAFAAAPPPDVPTIKNYTIDPSYNGGIYLAGRQQGSFLGLLGSAKPVLLNPPSDPTLIGDAAYQSYALNAASRPKRVLFTSQDGFLYAVDQQTGALAWGWMPRQFVSDLKNYGTFQSMDHFGGDFAVFDANDGTGYASYIVGTAENGAMHYALKLDSSGNPAKVAWTDYTAGNSSPNGAAPNLWRYYNGTYNVTYAVYLSGNVLTVRDVTAPATTKPLASVTLPFTASSTPVIQNNQIYIGSSTGDVWRGNLTNNSNKPANSAQLSFTDLGNYGDGNPILYVGYIRSNGSYLRAQSKTRLTIFRYGGNGAWSKAWTTYASGSGKWDAAGTYVADNTGTQVSTTGIQWLPAGALITDEAAVVNGAVILPVYVPDSVDQCKLGLAKYHLYSLNNGFFPTGTFTTTSGGAVSDNITLGYGRAMTPTFSIFKGSVKMFGLAQQKGQNSQHAEGDQEGSQEGQDLSNIGQIQTNNVTGGNRNGYVGWREYNN